MKTGMMLAVVLIAHIAFAGFFDSVSESITGAAGPGEREYREAMKCLQSGDVRSVDQLIRAAAAKKHPDASYILATLEDEGSASRRLKRYLKGRSAEEVFGKQKGYCFDEISIVNGNLSYERDYLERIPKTISLYECAATANVSGARDASASLTKRFAKYRIKIADAYDDLKKKRAEAKEEARRQKEESRIKKEEEHAKKEEEERKRKQEEMAAEQKVREEKGYTAHIDSFVGIRFGQPMGMGPFGNNRTDDGVLQYRKVSLSKPIFGICEAVVYGGVKSGKVCKVRLEKPAPFGMDDKVADQFKSMIRKRYGVSGVGGCLEHKYRLENGTITVSEIGRRKMGIGFEWDAKIVIEVRQDEAWNAAMAESRAEEDLDLL